MFVDQGTHVDMDLERVFLYPDRIRKCTSLTGIPSLFRFVLFYSLLKITSEPHAILDGLFITPLNTKMFKSCCTELS